MRALIVVDVQNDFLPGGALPVAEGDEIVAVVNALMEKFTLVVATQDWHPADHGSFAANHEGRTPGEVIDLDGLPQMLWPVHCVQNTIGAAFAPGLNTRRFDAVFPKGLDPRVDSYSGFFDNGRRRETGLAEYLRAKGATELYLVGLAYDYCVRATALDAVDLGFRTFVVDDACRGIDLPPGRMGETRTEFAARGAGRILSNEV